MYDHALLLQPSKIVEILVVALVLSMLMLDEHGLSWRGIIGA